MTVNHCDVICTMTKAYIPPKHNSFVLGPRIGLDPQHDDFALPIPTCWYLNILADPTQAYKGLVTNYGEGGGVATKREGETCELLPLQKGESEQVLTMLKGGGSNNKFWGSFYAVA